MRLLARRTILQQSAAGFGLLGLRALMAAESPTANLLAPKIPHFAPKVKRVIFLFMHGGVSHIDSFDPKERLYRDNGKPLPIKRPLAFADIATARFAGGIITGRSPAPRPSRLTAAIGDDDAVADSAARPDSPSTARGRAWSP